MTDCIERSKAIAVIEALKYGDIAHDNETLAHNRALSEASAALSALPAIRALVKPC